MLGIILYYLLPHCLEAGFLSELEAHSFGLASWQMRLQDLSLPLVLEFIGLCNHMWIFTCVLGVLNSVLMLKKQVLLATELSPQPQCTLLFETGFILNPKITFLARLASWSAHFWYPLHLRPQSWGDRCTLLHLVLLR